MASTSSDRMRDVVSAVTPDLRAAGFTQRRRAFNRTAHDHVVHVISFQQGVRSLAGSFTVNLGVFLPAAYIASHADAEAPPAFVDAPDCQIRERIGSLMTGRDVWWRFDGPGIHLERIVGDAIEGHALPWLAARSTVASILGLHEDTTDTRILPDLAAAAADMGDNTRASRLVQRRADAIAAMDRTTDQLVAIHLGWLDRIRTVYAEPYGLDVRYPVIERTG